MVLWGWVTICGAGATPRRTSVDSDGRVALRLTAEALTTPVGVVSLQWGAERRQNWRDPIARVLWRALSALRAAV